MVQSEETPLVPNINSISKTNHVYVITGMKEFVDKHVIAQEAIGVTLITANYIQMSHEMTSFFIIYLIYQMIYCIFERKKYDIKRTLAFHIDRFYHLSNY